MSRNLAIPIALAILVVGVTVYWLMTSGFEKPVPFFARNDETSAGVEHVAGDRQASNSQAPEATENRPPGAAPPSDPGTVLFGSVTRSSGEPIDGARVLVRSEHDLSALREADRLQALRDRVLGKVRADRARLMAETKSDAEGRYSFDISDLPRGRYQVLATAPGRAPESKRWTWTPESTRLDFQLFRGESITGIALGPDRQAVPRATVEAVEEGGAGGRLELLVARTMTDADGRFRLDVGSGIYALTAQARGFAAEELRQVLAGSDVVVNLRPGRVLKGGVRGPDNQPVIGARVALYNNSRSRDRDSLGRSPANELQRKMFFAALDRSETDKRGQFQFAYLGSRRYVVVVEKRGFRPTEKSVVLLEEVETTEIEVNLSRGRVIKGRVRDESGNPVSAALVVVGRERGIREEGARQSIPLSRAVAAVQTDGEGRFRIDTLRKATYALGVESDDFVTHGEAGIDLGDKDKELEIVLERGRRLEGRVL